MQNKDFCHLHNHTEFSQLDGFGSIKNYVNRAKELGFKYLAITDHGNIDGTISFQRECKKQKIKSIIGCEAYIVPDAKIKDKNEKRYHCTLFVKNQQGWNNLLKILTYANLEGFYYKPRIDYDTLIDNIDGLVVLTGCSSTFLLHEEAFDYLIDLMRYTECFLEVMPHDFEDQKRINRVILDINERFKLSLIATNDCHYINKNDKKVQEVLLAIQRQTKWNDPKRWKFDDNLELWLKSADEMIESFRKQNVLGNKDIREALKNTIKVAKLCSDFEIQKEDIYLPDIKEYKNQDSNKILYDLCQTQDRSIYLGNLFPDEYNKRFEQEFEMISKKNFSKYFLIVYELVNWCHENNIMIGPGRGSVGGSLIAFILGITSVDPIKYNLLFFRFISEDRIDYPDIDVDFEREKRYLIKEHLEELYGKNNIAQVSNFLRMKSRMVIQDVARVFDVNTKETTNFTKQIDDNISIDEAINDTKEGRQYNKKYPEIIKLAKKLEGQVRGYGKHAAGIIVSAKDLRDGGKCNLRKSNDELVVNWDKEDIEYVGLMKLDVLALGTLDILNETKRLIKKNYDKEIIFEEIDLNDEKVLNEFSKGENVGSFQFNSYGISELCKKMGVDSFDDLVAINALYRPGPLRAKVVDKYIDRKKGKEYKSYNDKISEITNNTYGVIVYQEQVMRIANEVAGLSWHDSDRIRKVISKSKGSKEIAKYKDKFIQGCIDNKLNKKLADQLWKEIKTFGGYGFNMAHSTAYSIIGFWTQWCKVYYPTEFICANLTYGTDKQKDKFIKEAYRLGLSLVTPKVGISDTKIWTAKDNKLFVPFIEIKGIGDKTALQASQFKRKKKPVRKGFFKSTVEIQNEKKSKIERILDDIQAFDEDILPDNISKYFSFKVSNDPKILYPNLFKIVNRKLRSNEIEKALLGQIQIDNAIQKKRDHIKDEVLNCNKCSLIDECTRPVVTSRGLYNIGLIGESCGRNEDIEGKGFIGDAGDILWNEIGKYGLKRSKFHVGNIIKCWPSKTKKLGDRELKKYIEFCFPWIQEELKMIDCRLILGMGNICVKAFTGRDGGIKQLSGKTEWNEKNKLWISWCIHPASLIYNEKENKSLFEDGIKNFIETIKSLSGMDEILF